MQYITEVLLFVTLIHVHISYEVSLQDRLKILDLIMRMNNPDYKKSLLEEFQSVDVVYHLARRVFFMSPYSLYGERINCFMTK
jgi:hypothetical protein